VGGDQFSVAEPTAAEPHAANPSIPAIEKASTMECTSREAGANKFIFWITRASFPCSLP
jgi:hypothetical protein